MDELIFKYLTVFPGDYSSVVDYEFCTLLTDFSLYKKGFWFPKLRIISNRMVAIYSYNKYNDYIVLSNSDISSYFAVKNSHLIIKSIKKNKLILRSK